MKKSYARNVSSRFSRIQIARASTVSVGALLLLACNGQSADEASIQPAFTSVEQITALPDRTPRVVGGDSVDDNRYPWMVAVMERNAGNASDGQFCGGSLIADRWVLTAAHCIEDTRAGRVSVLIGQRNLNESGGNTINVNRIIAHPDYARLGYPDLALLELSDASGTQPIALPSRNNPVPTPGEAATVTGWGQISENGPATNELRESTMPIVAHQQCNQAYNGDIVEDAMVCAGTASGDKDSCYGDSGGPLFVKRGQSYVQAGVVSFGEACGLANVPGVYARVSSYHDWIAAYAPVTAFDGASDNDPDDSGDESDNGSDSEADNGTGTGTDTNTDTGVTTQNGITANCDGLMCSFSTSISGLDYFWDFADGYGDEGQSVSHQFDEAGDYEIYLGVIANNGDYTEHLLTVTVKDTNAQTSDSQSATSEAFSGKLNGWGDQADLPQDRETLRLPAGQLTATLTVPTNRRFIVFLDRFDRDTGEWTEQHRVRTQRGQADFDMRIDAGEYGLTVLSLGRGGNYDLLLDVTP